MLALCSGRAQPTPLAFGPGGTSRTWVVGSQSQRARASSIIGEVRRGWRAFGAWVLPGALLTFCLVSAASIGLFLLPVAVAVCVLVGRRFNFGAEALGFMAGAGLLVLGVGLAHFGEQTCPTSGSAVLRPGESASAECGDFPALPWTLTGAIVSLIALAAFALWRQRQGRTTDGPARD
jgi:hypothetical protein